MMYRTKPSIRRATVAYRGSRGKIFLLAALAVLLIIYHARRSYDPHWDINERDVKLRVQGELNIESAYEISDKNATTKHVEEAKFETMPLGTDQEQKTMKSNIEGSKEQDTLTLNSDVTAKKQDGEDSGISVTSPASTSSAVNGGDSSSHEPEGDLHDGVKQKLNGPPEFYQGSTPYVKKRENQGVELTNTQRTPPKMEAGDDRADMAKILTQGAEQNDMDENGLKQDATNISAAFNVSNANDIILLESDMPECKIFPDAVIAGFDSCGTTALGKFLELHDDVIVTESQEAYNYTNKSDIQSPENSCTPNGKVKIVKISGDRSPERINSLHTDSEEVKLIFIVRDPVSRMISQYVRRVEALIEPEGQFNSVVDSLMMDNNHAMPFAHTLFRNSLYSEELRIWLKYFKLSNIHIVDGENFIKNPAEEVNHLEAFLGLEHKISPENFTMNANSGYYCAVNNVCINSFNSTGRVSVSPSLKDALENYFKLYNKEFSQMTNRTFGWSQ